MICFLKKYKEGKHAQRSDFFLCQQPGIALADVYKGKRCFVRANLRCEKACSLKYHIFKKYIGLRLYAG
jgi:hypothetical protein